MSFDAEYEASIACRWLKLQYAKSISEQSMPFSPTRPSGPSWSSSCDDRVFVCVSVYLSPSHAIIFEATHWPSDWPSAVGLLDELVHLQFLDKNMWSKAKAKQFLDISICSKPKAKPLIGPQIGPPPQRARPSAISWWKTCVAKPKQRLALSSQPPRQARPSAISW